MSRYTELFANLKAKNEGAFVPFMNIGDPTQEDSVKIISALGEGGADALELGIPFSDPSADGPVIQRSDVRALNAGSTTARAFEVIKQIRDKYPKTPIGLLMYVNLVYAPGIDNFFAMCEANGVDSVLIPDIPVQMMDACPEWREAAAKHGIELVMISPPNADDETIKRIAEMSQGYVYLVSRAGVTGTERLAGHPMSHSLNLLRTNNAPPCLLGFGISRPEQVKQAIADGADGAISGSVLVELVEKHLDNIDEACQALKGYVASMKAATKK